MYVCIIESIRTRVPYHTTWTTSQFTVPAVRGFPRACRLLLKPEAFGLSYHMPPSFTESPFVSKRTYEAFLSLPEFQHEAALSAAPKHTAALQVQLHLLGRNKKRKAGDDAELVSIKSNSDRVVLCKLEAAQLSGMLARGLGTSGSLFQQTGFTVPIPTEILTLVVGALESSLMIGGEEHSSQLILESARQLVADDFFALFAAAKCLECEQLSMSLCCHLAALLRGKSPSEIREEFNIAADMSLEIEAVSLAEPVFEPPSGAYSANTRVAPGGALAPAGSGEQLPAVMHSGNAQPTAHLHRSLSARMGDEDSVQELLKACELRTLRTLKGVSFAWRERARLALSSVSSAWRQHTFAPRSELAAQLELSRMQYFKQMRAAHLHQAAAHYSRAATRAARGDWPASGRRCRQIATRTLKLTC